LNGLSASSVSRRSHQFSDESSGPEEAWSDRELDLLESVRDSCKDLSRFQV
jgi:hypothetical protein